MNEDIRCAYCNKLIIAGGLIFNSKVYCDERCLLKDDEVFKYPRKTLN